MTKPSATVGWTLVVATLQCLAVATLVRAAASGAAVSPDLAETDIPARLVVFEAFSRST